MARRMLLNTLGQAGAASAPALPAPGSGRGLVGYMGARRIVQPFVNGVDVGCRCIGAVVLCCCVCIGVLAVGVAVCVGCFGVAVSVIASVAATAAAFVVVVVLVAFSLFLQMSQSLRTHQFPKNKCAHAAVRNPTQASANHLFANTGAIWTAVV